ncbi:MAG: DUF6159 family protein [Candidatus Spechtbacterales bacterium]
METSMMPIAGATQQQPHKIGKFKGSFLLLRASWSTLKMDRELLLLPLYSMFAGLAVFLVGVAFVVLAMQVGIISYEELEMLFSGTEEPSLAQTALSTGYLFIVGLGVALTTNFFTAALVAAALYRFSGGNPTVGYALQKAREHFWAIAAFTLLSWTVLSALRFISERVPFAGKMITAFLGVAWSLATMFAVPHIVATSRHVGPLEAVKESAGVFRKTWGENFIGGIGLSVIFAIVLVPVVLLLIAGPALAVAYGGLFTLIVTAPFAIAVLIALAAGMEAISGIFRAALYHYATTGESPAAFDKELLRAAFKPKKGWFV